MTISLFKKLSTGKPLSVNDKSKPAISDKTLKLINSKSFTDLLPVKQCSGDGIFYFRDLQNVGAMFGVSTISLDVKSDNDKQEILEGLNFAIKQAIPAEYTDLWLSQIFVTKVKAKEATFEAIKKHSADTKFSKHWLCEIDKHLTELENPDGAFVDKNTGLKFTMAKTEVAMCVWQEITNNDKQKIEDRFKKTKDILERLSSALEQTGISINPYLPQDYINNISRFFHEQKTTYNPNVFTLVDSDLSQESLGETAISCDKGVFTFVNNGKTRHSIYLAVEKITKEPNLGYITAEQKNGTAIFDRLPVGSTWVQTTVHMHEDLATQQLEQISKSVLGTDSVAVKNKEAALHAINEIAQGNSTYRFSAGVYLSTNDKDQIDKMARDTKAVLGAKGIELLDLKQNPMAEQDFIANLPFSFSYEKDKAFYNKRAILQDLNLVSKLAPFVGRSTGTGSAGLLKFNRGGEPLMFDPITDKSNNAFGLLFGPSGSGKSAFLIEKLFEIIRSHNPRAVFILEKGNSFGLAVDHLKNTGLSTNKMSITASGENVSLPPFADAIKLFDEKNTTQKIENRDLLEELSLAAQLMITGVNKKEIDEFRQRDLDTIATAIKNAAKNTFKSGRNITLTQDVASAMHELSNDDDLTTIEKERIRAMSKSIKGFISSSFSNAVFNSEGVLFPETDVTHLDVGYLGKPNQESKLLIAFMALMSEINRLAEENEFSGRPIIVYVDEAHLFTKHATIIAYFMTMIKMWRKWNVWVWLATPSLEDYTTEAKSMFGTIEWVIVLQANSDEINQLSKLKSLSKPEITMLNSMKGSKLQYKEGVVISENITTLFRSISTSLALALAMTEPNEKAERKKIMDEFGCSELEAAYKMADKISKSRSGQGV